MFLLVDNGYINCLLHVKALRSYTDNISVMNKTHQTKPRGVCKRVRAPQGSLEKSIIANKAKLKLTEARLHSSMDDFKRRYNVFELIKKSANGVIYGAIDRRTNTNVVIKQITKHPSIFGTFGQFVPREIEMHRLASQSHHNNVVKLLNW